MAAFLGVLSALSIGISDLFGRRLIAASSALTAGATMQLFSLVFVLMVAAATASPIEVAPIGWGGVSGLGLGIGIGFYYTGLVNSSATVVAPIVASFSALIPFCYTLLRGATAGALAIGGAIVVVVGLVLITKGTASAGELRSGVGWGVLSGLGYSLGAIGFVEAADADGWWPAVGQRGAAMVLLFAVAAIRRVRPLPPSGHWRDGVLTGATVAATSLLYLASLAADPTVGVITISSFPAFSVLIGRVFFGDPVRSSQAVGIVAVIVGMAAVSV
ncbi:MAG: DMT family transporter [Actinomycetota bacterium]